MIKITTYKIQDIEDWDEFVNKLFNGLKYYETRNQDFSFKITYTKDQVELKTVKLGIHAN
jgi:hypothetical protein